jgi:hypothetical protein
MNISNNTIAISNNAKAKIELSLLTNTNIEWIVPNDYKLHNAVIIKEKLRLDNGNFNCFLLNATFELSYYSDGAKILFLYKSKITYMNGGTNGFDCRFIFDLEGNFLETKY